MSLTLRLEIIQDISQRPAQDISERFAPFNPYDQTNDATFQSAEMRHIASRRTFQTAPARSVRWGSPPRLLSAARVTRPLSPSPVPRAAVSINLGRGGAVLTAAVCAAAAGAPFNDADSSAAGHWLIVPGQARLGPVSGLFIGQEGSAARRCGQAARCAGHWP